MGAGSLVTNAVANAIARASRGLDWSYPCLIWVADYLLDATGIDYAAEWRAIDWTEAAAKHALARLAAGGSGATAVEKALDTLARAAGWLEADGPRQGAIMVGVYTAEDGVGVPAIFDGNRRWIVTNDGRSVSALDAEPVKMWEVLFAPA